MTVFASNDNETFPEQVFFEVFTVFSHFLGMAEAAQDIDLVIINCVAFFNEEGKGSKLYGNENRFKCHEIKRFGKFVSFVLQPTYMYAIANDP